MKKLLQLVKVSNKEIDFASSEDFKWILKHFDSDNVTIYMGSKTYDLSKNDFVYSYLKKGAIQTDGHRFKVLETYFSNSAK